MTDDQDRAAKEQDALEAMIRMRDPQPTRAWRDSECPKCGLKLSNRMMYCCPNSHCPSGLN